MKNSGEAIERVLTGLQETATPVGMERRILEAIQERTSAKSVPGGLWLRSELRPARPWAWAIALAGTMAVCVAILVMHRMEHVPTQAKLQPAPASPSLPVAPEDVAKSAELSPVPAAQLREKSHIRRTSFVRDTDSVALSEMRAPSRPEPPLPLTDQEKLLLRIVHRGNPQQMAELDPAKRAQQIADEKAEVERFFGRSTTGDSE